MICGNCEKEIGYDSETVARHLDGNCEDVAIADRLCPCTIFGDGFWLRRILCALRNDDTFISWATLDALALANGCQSIMTNKAGQQFIVAALHVGIAAHQKIVEWQVRLVA